MKRVWIKSIPWKKETVIAALESGADAVVVPKGYSAEVKKLGLIKTVAEDGDFKLGEDVVEWEIKGKDDEEVILKMSRSKQVIVRSKDWTIIPLENLVAQTGNLIVEVENSKEAQTMLGVLEKGVDGVLLDSPDAGEVKRTVQGVRDRGEAVQLATAKVTLVEPLGMGDRVCIDTCTNMGLGEGMLIGNSSGGLFLVHSESIENPYVEPRPFRVNAGPVHAYVKVPGGKTKYLSELKSGEDALIVDYRGRAAKAVVGRVKVERRPLMLVEAEAGQQRISIILQNAETIRLTDPEGKPISVVQLKEGSQVVVACEETGRHFGMKIDETISEK